MLDRFGIRHLYLMDNGKEFPVFIGDPKFITRECNNNVSKILNDKFKSYIKVNCQFYLDVMDKHIKKDIERQLSSLFSSRGNNCNVYNYIEDREDKAFDIEAKLFSELAKITKSTNDYRMLYDALEYVAKETCFTTSRKIDPRVSVILSKNTEDPQFIWAKGTHVDIVAKKIYRYFPQIYNLKEEEICS